jgi:hypothetical protein
METLSATSLHQSRPAPRQCGHTGRKSQQHISTRPRGQYAHFALTSVTGCFQETRTRVSNGDTIDWSCSRLGLTSRVAPESTY